jgi:two-component system sensor histidine kinase AdeS
LTGLGGLRARIAVRMAFMTLCGFALAVVCAFFVYSWVFRNHPTAVPPPDEWVPQTSDWLIIAALIAAALLIAIASGVQLARRIVLPLDAIADAARRIANDDLTARARIDDRTGGEIAGLADDFNHMAERLESLNRGMVDWNASIAHELRTPVTILRGRLQGVADGVFAMDERTLTSLLRQVDGLARLVEDLRVVSLADGGHLDLRLELIDLAAIVDELQPAVTEGLTAAGLVSQWRLERATIVADPTRLRQAVLALIENARVHAEPGALVIRNEVQGPDVIIAVDDDGPGLPDALRTTAFEPFQRNRARAQGSGLGLAVVRAVAEAHGGRAAYRPNGRGSTFEIRLPRAATAD